jgi:hypothetical protein
MVMSRSWFDRQTRGNLLDNADYDHDVEEAASIGRSVNEVAVKRDRAAHGLAVDVWSLIWRSTVVAVAQELPTSAWAVLVRVGEVRPRVALQYALAVGDERLRAERLITLGRMMTLKSW